MMIRLPRTGISEGSERISDNTPAIYGSLLVTTLVAVQWKAEAVPELIGISLVIGVGVFWLAHVWAGVINRRVYGPISIAEVGPIALGEAPILLAAVIPGLLLGLHRVFGVSVDAAIGLALGASLAQLFLWGLAVGRAAHDSWPVAVSIGLVDLAFGATIVVLKAVVLH